MVVRKRSLSGHVCVSRVRYLSISALARCRLLLPTGTNFRPWVSKAESAWICLAVGLCWASTLLPSSARLDSRKEPPKMLNYSESVVSFPGPFYGPKSGTIFGLLQPFALFRSSPSRFMVPFSGPRIRAILWKNTVRTALFWRAHSGGSGPPHPGRSQQYRSEMS